MAQAYKSSKSDSNCPMPVPERNFGSKSPVWTSKVEPDNFYKLLWSDKAI